MGWAAEAGVDFLSETIRYLGEASIALEVIREAGLPSVVLLVAGHEPVTPRDDVAMTWACREPATRGADVVSLDRVPGPATMLPLLGPTAAAVDVPVAALPVPYRTHPAQPTSHAARATPGRAVARRPPPAGDGRATGSHAGGEQVLPGHVQARLPRRDTRLRAANQEFRSLL